jgi:phosphoglycolate phosphatase-like HAD superfamily hydrolase
MGKVKGVILDVDGTLVDSNDQHALAWRDAFRRATREFPLERIRRLIGAGGDKLYHELTGEDVGSAEGQATSADCKKIFQQVYLPQVRSFARSKELVQRFQHAGLKLAVASSARPQDLEALLKIAGVPELKEMSTTSDDADRSKPDPDVVQVALDKLKLRPEETLMLGDTPYDIESGRRAGVAVVAVRSGGWGDADLSDAVAIYDDPADLLEKFDDSPFAPK